MRVADEDDPFKRGVVEAIYRSGTQKRRRMLATTLLLMKHTLRGLLFSWPLYLLGLAPLMSEKLQGFGLMLLLIPAIYLSWRILGRGVREEHAALISGMIMPDDYLRRVLWLRE